MLDQALVDVGLAVCSVEASTVAPALVLPDQIDALASVLAWRRLALVDVRLAEDAGVAQAARAHWRYVRRETEAAVPARLDHAERNITEGSRETRTALACEVVPRRCV